LGKEEVNVPEMPGLVNLFDKPEIQQGFAAAPPLKDERIKAIFVMSPAVGQGFPTKKNFSDLKFPAYIITVGMDKITPLKTNAAHYAGLIPGSQYSVIDENAGHYVFLNEAKNILKNNAPTYFSDPPSVNRKIVHDKALALAVGHFKKVLGQP
jgi:predicted dienelactone hydrolase